MANRASRLILFRSTATPRWYSTSTATIATKDQDKSLYRRLSALGGTDADVAGTLDEWVKQGNPVTRTYIISVVTNLRKFKKYQHAVQIYDWMEKSKNRMNNADRAIRIDLLSKTEGVASAENYFNSLPRSAKTNKTYGALLKCYCKEKMFDKAMEVFKKMKELNFISTLNYNNMMSLYLSVGQPEQVPLLSKEMEEKNIAADLYTYNQLMNSYGSLKDLDAVEGVMEKMETNKIKRDWFTYGNLATIYVNEGLIDKAFTALQKLENMKNLRDREAFQTLIKLYGRTSCLSGVNRAWESLKKIFPKPANISYLIMLLTLSKLGDVDGLEKCFREWEAGFSTYDVRVSNVVLESYLNRDMIKEADSVYNSIVERGAEPNLRTLNSFIKFYLKNHQMDLALKYLEMGVSRIGQSHSYGTIPEKVKWFPSDEAVNIFLTNFEEKKDVDSAEKFCKLMQKIGCLNSNIFASLLRTHTASGTAEPQIRQRLEEFGIEISPESEKLLQKLRILTRLLQVDESNPG